MATRVPVGPLTRVSGLISGLVYPGASQAVELEQVKRTLWPGEEIVWQETTRGERVALIVRPPSSRESWIVFFYGNAMTVVETWDIRQWLSTAGHGVVCVEYAGFGISFGSPSEYGCYRSADAAITYLRQQASASLDRIMLVGWSLGSAVAIDLASRRDTRAQVLLSPMTSLVATALDLAHLGRHAPFTSLGPFAALQKARSVVCPTLIVSGSEDVLTRPWMATELAQAMGGRVRQLCLPDIGHNDLLSSGDRLWDAVADFLKSPEGM